MGSLIRIRPRAALPWTRPASAGRPLLRVSFACGLFLHLTLSGCGPALIGGAIALVKSFSSEKKRCTIAGEEVSVNLEGSIRYQKRPVDPNLPTTTLEPVRGARVEVLRMNCGEEVIGTADTGDDGSYSVAVTTPSGSLLRVSVLSQRVDPSSPAAVRNNARDRLIYSLESADLSLTSQPVQGYQIDLDATIDCSFQVAGAFNILEQTRRAFEAVKAASLPPPDHPLTVLWALGEPDGTFFSVSPSDLNGDGLGGDPFLQLRGGAFISGCRNTDQFDDGIIIHEFGHYVAFLYSEDSSPGGSHATSELIDPRVAWSEGWANFFSCMVRNDPNFIDTSEVLRQNGQPVCSSGVCPFSEFNLETKAGCSPLECCQGIGSEDAVGALLWDILDPANEVNDAVDLPASSILSALVSLRSKGHHFVYVGDFIEEIELEAAALAPPQDQPIRLLVEDEGMTDPGGEVTAFPKPFDSQSQSGDRLQASASGMVNGCDDSLCKDFVENFIDSSAFYKLLLPGSPDTPGRLSASLSITPAGSSCGHDLQLRIFNQEQALFFSTEGQSGLQKTLDFPLDTNFPRGSSILVEVAGDTETPAGSGQGQKASFVITVNVE
jgi:hypothetical protein